MWARVVLDQKVFEKTKLNEYVYILPEKNGAALYRSIYLYRLK